MNDVKSYAVIVAAGKGTRMGNSVPKQFITFHGKPLMCHALQAFSDALPGITLVLVVPGYHLSSVQIVMKTFMSGTKVQVVAGGDTRFQSVKSGLKEVKNDGIVFVHDGARPLVTKALILNCYRQAIARGSAIPCIPVTESVRLLDEDGASRPVNRDHLRIIQTPQTFRTEILLPAFEQPYQALFTDEATVVESFGTTVFLIDGLTENIKITTQEDLLRAEALFNAKN